LDNFSFVYSWEGEREVILAVSIELTVIFGYMLSQLLFLKLPDVQFLAGVLENFYICWEVDSGLR